MTYLTAHEYKNRRLIPEHGKRVREQRAKDLEGYGLRTTFCSESNSWIKPHAKNMIA